MNKKEIVNNIKDLAYDMYQVGYTEGSNTNLIDEAYQEGLNDVWRCIKRIAYPTCDGGLSADELYEIFRSTHISHILKNYLPSEAIQKIKDYEEQQKQADAEIRVGDEVIVNGDRAIVIKVDIDYWYRVVYENGNTNYIHQDTIMDKTGKHYSQIEEVLKELAGGENNADSD